MCMYMCVYMCMCISVYVYVYKCICVCVCVCLCVCMCISVYVYVYVYVYVCVCVYMCMSFLSQKSQPKPSLAKRRKCKHSSLKSYKKVSSLLTFHLILFKFSFIFSATKQSRQSTKKNPHDLVLKIMYKKIYSK